MCIAAHEVFSDPQDLGIVVRMIVLANGAGSG